MFVKELEITLENGMKISGELDLPERQGQWKTIILFHGSGPSDRHATVESMGGIVSRNFDLLSEGFVKARYAVFRYDKRENYDIEIIIRDAREVTRFVSGLSEVEGILFYGWSEGVRVCTTLVSDFPNAQALILQSGIAEGWSSYFSYILRELTVPSVKETFEQIWPDAVKKALEILFKQNRTEKMSMAQYQIYVSKLWSEICQKVGYMNIVDYDNFGDIKSIFYDLEKRHLIKKENDGIE